MAMAGQLEVEKLTALGKEIGLEGQDLLEFIRTERAELKAQRDAERANRAAEREAEIARREADEKRFKDEQNFEREKQQYAIQKAADERKFILDQAAAEAARKDLEFKRKMEEFKRKETEAEIALEREEKALKMQIAIEEAKIKQVELNKSGSKGNPNIRSKVPRLPNFDESKDNIDAYLIRFERYASTQGWPKPHWAVNLSTLLSGKGLEVYYSLNETQAEDYDYLKKAILNRYELNEEGFRSKFKSCKPEEGESGVQYGHRILKYFERWTELAHVDESKEGIIDFIIRDQFLHSIPKQMAMFIREREPSDIGIVTELADQYLKAHRSWWGPANNTQKVKNANTKQPNSRRSFNAGKPQQKESSGKAGQDRPKAKPKGACYICGRQGHHAKDCYKRPQVNALLGHHSKQSEANDDAGSTKIEDSDKVAFLMMTPDSNSEMFPGHTVYTVEKGQELPMVTAACHPQPEKDKYVVRGLVGKHQVKLLRDSGCDGVVIKKSLVEPSQLTGKTKTCLLIDRTVRRFPIAEIEIDTPYFTGKVSAMCVVNPVHPLVLGEVPGVREPGNPNPTWNIEERLNPKPTTDTVLQDANKRSGDLRTSNTEELKDSKNQQEEENRRQLIYDESSLQTDDKAAMVETRGQRKEKMKPFKPLITIPASEDIVTTELLKQKQLSDVTLSKPREMAATGEVKEGKNGSRTSYIIDKGILYREFSSPTVDFGNKFHQVVVPVDYRRYVLQIAHESILGGHQGAKRTSDKVMANFYWPGIGADIRRYCQSCDICQRTTPKGRVCKVPLGDMPIIDTPFERVAVDLVGPIKPVTERGHRYILVLVDYATRYPEAIPLKSIETEVIAEALLDMFSRLGIPKQILTDRGSQFMSGVMREVSRLLSIQPLATTPYHAMCNGLVERYNGVLKSSLKKMCEERPRDWDRYISPLLFAYRETPQSSTTFSPFELLYGRDIRGPMTILKELWTGQYEEGETKTTYQYVIDLQERLEKTCQLAREELRKAKEKHRMYYNKKARSRTFKEGDEVLLLLPTDHNKLLMQWKGPFKVVKKLSSMNYQIDMGSRIQTFHANLLKQYFRREQERQDTGEIEKLDALTVIAAAVIEDEKDDEIPPGDPFRMTNEELLHLPPLTPSETVKDVNVSEELEEQKHREMKRELGNCKDILTDIPGRTPLTEHAIHLSDKEEVRSKPYPIPHALRKVVQKEVDLMLRMGIITKSVSPYASPLTLVAKPDGTYRACVDTRKLNAKTEFDAEPVPDQEEIFSQLANDHYFSKIDLSKGYWQIPMEEKSKKYTAFVTHSGLYQFEVLPFGLVNSAATFNRMMRTLLHGLKNVHNYVDDILIHTRTWEEHMVAVREVFRRLRKANLTARPSKCYMGYSEVEFLGHVVGHGVVKPKPHKIEAIQNAERPKTKTQLRSFLGLAGYYRKFIPDFAAIACPLTDRTKKGESNKIRWEKPQAESFNTLKSKLACSPILHLPDLERTFILRSDASDRGIGAVLMQEFSGEKFPIAYASKKLTNAQMAYSVMEKECLAIVWAVLRFQPFLYGREFVIETDHQPLTCLKKSKVVNSRIMRWALALQPYRFRLEIIKGSKNVGADYMSRSTQSNQTTWCNTPAEGIKICVGIFV